MAKKSDFPFLASDEAIKAVGGQVALCLQVGDALGWPQVEPEHGRQLIREIVAWRRIAGLLPSKEEGER